MMVRVALVTIFQTIMKPNGFVGETLIKLAVNKNEACQHVNAITRCKRIATEVQTTLAECT